MAEHDDPYNLPGPIAERYHELQGLDHLHAAWDEYPVEKASRTSVLKAVMQAAQIGLLNMEDLLRRAIADIRHANMAAAATKREWEARFSRVLNDVSRVPERIAVADMRGSVTSIFRTSAFDAYLTALRAFDREAGAQEHTGILPLQQAIGSGSMNEAACRLVQYTRLSSHDALPWERNLRHLHIGTVIAPENERRFLGEQHLRNAVHALAAQTPALKDHTFFNQFRGLHQIPEILVHEQNDHIEQAIADIYATRFSQALEHLALAEALFEPIIASVRGMSEALTTDDYHRFRKHLGLTSGSHSEEIRHRLFLKNYRELWDAVAHAVTPAQIAAADRQRHENADAYLKHQLLNACQNIRASILRWRDSHLHLVRNNLGGGGTRSLIGSRDAIEAVTRMHSAAHGEHDVLQPLLAARGLAATVEEKPLERYLKGDESLRGRIEDVTGQIAQQRFPDVQYRTGRFSPAMAGAPATEEEPA